MPVSVTGAPEQVRYGGPGVTWFADAGALNETETDAWTATASVFTSGTSTAAQVPGSAATGAFQAGYTDDGFEFNTSVDTEDVEVEELDYPIATLVTKRSARVRITFAQINWKNWRLANNAASSSFVTVTGSTTTLVTRWDPPAIGGEVRHQLVWHSNDGDEVIVGWQVFQIGELSITRRKGAEKATIAAEFNFELPATTIVTPAVPFTKYFAGSTKFGTS